jgi:pimeloyl-ACP methyl ester carboxylesterase
VTASPDACPLTELVLLSGMLGDHTVWSDVAADLGDIAHCTVPRIDQADRIPALSEAVLAEAPERFALAGHSLGGIVALQVLRDAPERVTRLALVNTSARGASAAQLASWAELAGRTHAGEFAAVAWELGRHTLPEARRADDLVARNIAMADTVGAPGFLRQLQAQATRPDSRPHLAEVGVPTLVVSGALDHVCPPALQEELAAGIPGARHVVLESAGHMAPLEAPHEVAQALRVWLTT